MLFLPYMQTNTLTIVISLNLFTEKIFFINPNNLSIPDKAKVNAKCYVELCYPG